MNPLPQYYAERLEDKWIAENIQLPEHGYYLDLGCAWPKQYSNTAFLRDRGWSGLAIDGNNHYAPYWHGIAPFMHAVIGDGNPVQFESNGVPELSRVGSGPTVPTYTLENLIVGSPEIDFLSCDLEGHEFAALSTLDWTKHRPKVVISEFSTHGLGEDFRVRDMLVALGYTVRLVNEANIVFTL